MRYLSVCSGIEAATVAWHSLGWEPAGFSEIEKFPSQVLAHHYPAVPNLGDMTNYKEWDIGTVDLLVGGTPCQSFSVAGLRKGMADPRGNLALVYCGILDHFRPKWFVWENVPGVLSSGGGRDFGSFLGALAELGYGFAYRVLDAQWFGVAQRRRRVFVVGCLGDWRSAAAVLFERQSLCRNLAPSRETWQKVAPTVVQGPPYSRTGNERVECEAIVPVSDPAYCLETTCNDYSRADGFNMVATPIALAENTIGRQPMNGGNGNGFTVGGPMYTLNATGVHGVAQPIPFDTTQITSPSNYSNPKSGDPCHPLAAGAHPPAVANAMAVRRLTPTECERLQGFPDGYTDIQPNRKQTPDGPRYKALGNSMAVPVMKWIGERIGTAEKARAKAVEQQAVEI
jgi:DNA (cytosine-5)-methyltransferase 1